MEEFEKNIEGFFLSLNEYFIIKNSFLYLKYTYGGNHLHTSYKYWTAFGAEGRSLNLHNLNLLFIYDRAKVYLVEERSLPELNNGKIIFQRGYSKKSINSIKRLYKVLLTEFENKMSDEIFDSL